MRQVNSKVNGVLRLLSEAVLRGGYKELEYVQGTRDDCVFALTLGLTIAQRAWARLNRNITPNMAEAGLRLPPGSVESVSDDRSGYELTLYLNHPFKRFFNQEDFSASSVLLHTYIDLEREYPGFCTRADAAAAGVVSEAVVRNGVNPYSTVPNYPKEDCEFELVVNLRVSDASWFFENLMIEEVLAAALKLPLYAVIAVSVSNKRRLYLTLDKPYARFDWTHHEDDGGKYWKATVRETPGFKEEYARLKDEHLAELDANQVIEAVVRNGTASAVADIARPGAEYRIVLNIGGQHSFIGIDEQAPEMFRRVLGLPEGAVVHCDYPGYRNIYINLDKPYSKFAWSLSQLSRSEALEFNAFYVVQPHELAMLIDNGTVERD